MAKPEILDTFWGKYNRFDVVKSGGKFYVHRDGEPYRGSFEDRSDAVWAAHEEAEK